MNAMKKVFCLALALCLICGLAAGASASTFTDAHGNEIELDDSLEAYTEHVLYGADDAARKGETNPNVQQFVDWMLSEEGQAIVEGSGYVGVK